MQLGKTTKLIGACMHTGVRTGAPSSAGAYVRLHTLACQTGELVGTPVENGIGIPCSTAWATAAWAPRATGPTRSDPTARCSKSEVCICTWTFELALILRCFNMHVHVRT
jgi:hypothetical protein